MWLECRFLTEVDGLNPGISMLCARARNFISITSVDSSSSSRKVQLLKSEDKRTALVAGCEDETKHNIKYN